MVIGEEKGRGVNEKVKRNFGMPKPEGYRKALRLMETAERFKLPVLTLIDTPGAYPGIDSEERNISRGYSPKPRGNVATENADYLHRDWRGQFGWCHWRLGLAIEPICFNTAPIL